MDSESADYNPERKRTAMLDRCDKTPDVTLLASSTRWEPPNTASKRPLLPLIRIAKRV
jgi:hypothetical protein